MATKSKINAWPFMGKKLLNLLMVNFDHQLIGLKMARRLVSYVCEDSSTG